MAKTTGDGIPIPDVIDPPDSMKMTLCIPRNRDHMAAFFGALYQLTVWQSWQEDAAHNGTLVAQVWWRYFLSWNRTMNEIECEDDMGKCCVEPPIIKRTNPTTGMIEQSSDGGANWGMEAGGLPTYIVEPIPPVDSGVAGTKCDAATNLSGQVDVWITQVTNDFDTATTLLEFGLAVLEAILLAVVTILTAGTLTAAQALVLPAIGAALAAAWGAGKAVFVAYWSTEIKDKILCAAFCNIGANGSFTDAQFSAFWNKVNNDLPASPAKMLFMGFLSSVGRQGVNAMAATGLSADADCNDCACTDSCIDNWSWPTDDFGANPSVVKDTENNWITAPAILIGTFYYWGFEATQCCNMQVTITEGSTPSAFKGLIPCPEPEAWSFYDESIPPWVGAPLTITGNAFAVMARSATPFTARIEFV